jgi:hypothetical protein
VTLLRRIVLSAFVIGLLAAAVVLVAQVPASDSAQAGATPATRVVKRTVLPDGTIQFEYADGTTKRVPSEPAQPSAEDRNTNGTTEADQMAPIAPPSWLKDPATHKVFLEAMAEYYLYRSSGLQHRRRVFEWQLFSSKIIFVTVLMLVGLGIIFAALQFRAGLKRTQADVRDAATEIAFSTTSVKVSSPVLGVIILVISLAFFYLYLVYVYPISELV